MSIKCQNCGKELTDRPEEAVEEGKLKEVFSRTTSAVESPYISETEYFCSFDCLMAYFEVEYEEADRQMQFSPGDKVKIEIGSISFKAEIESCVESDLQEEKTIVLE